MSFDVNADVTAAVWLKKHAKVVAAGNYASPAAVPYGKVLSHGDVHFPRDPDVGKAKGGLFDLRGKSTEKTGDYIVLEDFTPLMMALNFVDGGVAEVLPKARLLAQATADAIGLDVSDLEIHSTTCVSSDIRVTSVNLRVVMRPEMSTTNRAISKELLSLLPHNKPFHTLKPKVFISGAQSFISGSPTLTCMAAPHGSNSRRTIMYAKIDIGNMNVPTGEVKSSEFSIGYSSAGHTPRYSDPLEIAEAAFSYACLEKEYKNGVTFKHRFNATLTQTRDALLAYFVSSGYWAIFQEVIRIEKQGAYFAGADHGDERLVLELRYAIHYDRHGVASSVRIMLQTARSKKEKDDGLYAYLNFLDKERTSEGGSQYRNLLRAEFSSTGFTTNNLETKFTDTVSSVFLNRNFHQQFSYTVPRYTLLSAIPENEKALFGSDSEIEELIEALGVHGEYLAAHVSEVLSVATARTKELAGRIHVTVKVWYHNVSTLSRYEVHATIEHRQWRLHDGDNTPMDKDTYMSTKETETKPQEADAEVEASEAAETKFKYSYSQMAVSRPMIYMIRSPELVFNTPIDVPENTRVLRPFSGVYTEESAVNDLVRDFGDLGLDFSDVLTKLQNHACDQRDKRPQLVLGSMRARVLFVNSDVPGGDERAASVMFYYEAHDSPVWDAYADDGELTPVADLPGAAHTVQVGELRYPEMTPERQAEVDAIADGIIDEVLEEEKQKKASIMEEHMKKLRVDREIQAEKLATKLGRQLQEIMAHTVLLEMDRSRLAKTEAVLEYTKNEYNLLLEQLVELCKDT